MVTKKILISTFAVVMIVIGGIAVAFGVYRLNHTGNVQPAAVETIEVAPTPGIDYIKLDVADIPETELASACARLMPTPVPTPSPTVTVAPTPTPKCTCIVK